MLGLCISRFTLKKDVTSKSSNGLIQMAVVGEIVLIGLSLLKEMVGILPVAQLVNLWLEDHAKEDK